jgi:hypothetical protein
VRSVALLLLLVPSIAAAWDFVDADVVAPPPPRFSIGFKVTTSLPSLSFNMTSQPSQFGSVQQDTPNVEIDVPATYRVLPWLRAEAMLGFTEQQINWNADCMSGAPCLEYVSQDAIVAGAGAQAFYRSGSWEGYADLAVRVPFQIQNAHALYVYDASSFDGQLSGGETVALAAGIARRVDSARIFVELGYLHSLVNVSANGLGLSASFGGVMFAGGISVW